MKAVIPMAGEGRRFKEAGYGLPKPFIDVAGRPMIKRVFWSIFPYGYGLDKAYFICQKRDLALLTSLFQTGENMSFIPLDEKTEGAACTVLKAKDFIDDGELLIANSDQIIGDNDWLLRMSRLISRNQDADCVIPCFLNGNPKWSYARYEGDRITEIAEKKVISGLATCGVYWFRHGTDFVRAAEAMIAKNARVNGEFYVAPAINELIAEGKRVLPFMVNEMHGLGTPEDLQVYLNRREPA